MIRVAFVLEGAGWQGGINYYRNLLSALQLIKPPALQPVMFVGTQVPEAVVENFQHAEIVRSRLLDSAGPVGLLRRLTRRLAGQRDLLLVPLLLRHRIDVLSHSGPIWPKRNIRNIGWITDFQHVHLPAYFSTSERAQRDALFRRVAQDSERVLLSSEAARRDLAAFAPAALPKSRVLHFVPQIDASDSGVSVSALQEKYGFQTPYFFLPNQFWAHKNHKVVIEALAELRHMGVHATVLATGNTRDYRSPGHFAGLTALADHLRVSESFRVLGEVPYADLIALMKHARAVINPSLFEGWSSTVEEAKALGVSTLLSDIPVHREQNPPNGLYFPPDDAHQLALLMRLLLNTQDGKSEVIAGDDDSYLAARREFAQAYQDIVVELMEAA